MELKGVPFLDLKRQFEQEELELIETVTDVLKSGWYLMGEKNKSFEFELARFLSPEHTVVGCNSGTDAIVLSLLALGVEPGDEVLVPSMTAIPTATAVASMGAIPVFADMDPETWLIDLGHAQNLKTEKTKAIIAVHLYGNMVDITRMFSGVPVIEDCAQSFGSTLGGHLAGTLGECAAFSFYPSKNLAALGDAGAVCCVSQENALKVRQLAFYGQADRYDAKYRRGINSRLDEIQAAVLSLRLKRVEDYKRKKRNLVEIYRNELSSLPLQFQKVAPNCEPHWHLMVIRTESEKVRDDLLSFLDKNGVGSVIHYPKGVHEQKAFEYSNRGPLLQTEKFSSEILSLPLYPFLSEQELNMVIHTVKEFFGSRGS